MQGPKHPSGEPIVYLSWQEIRPVHSPSGLHEDKINGQRIYAPRAHTQLMFVAPLMNGPTVSGLGHQHGEVHFFALDRHIATIYTYMYVNAAYLLICDKASPTCSEQFVPFSMVVNNNKLKKLVPLKGPLPSFQSNSQNRDLSTAPQ